MISVDRAREIVKSNPALEIFHGWNPSSDVRGGKPAVRFQQPPEAGHLVIVTDRVNGQLFVYSECDIEFVSDDDEEGATVPLILIEEGTRLVEEKEDGFLFDGVVPGEEDEILLSFAYADGIQYRPCYLFNPDKKSLEYLPG